MAQQAGASAHTQATVSRLASRSRDPVAMMIDFDYGKKYLSIILVSSRQCSPRLHVSETTTAPTATNLCNDATPHHTNRTTNQRKIRAQRCKYS